MENNCGIYLWKNIITNKVYVGQSVNLNNRKKDFYNFKFPYAGSLINNVRKKYNNKSYWEYSILEYCDDSDLNEKEIYYIELYDSTNRDKGYNIGKGGDANNTIPIYQINIGSGEIVNSYNSITEATNNPNIEASSICACCKHNMSYYKDYIWIYQEEYSKELIREIQKKIKLVKSHYVSEETRRKQSEKRIGKIGKLHTEETKEIIRQKAIGREQTEEAKNKKKRKIFQFTKDGEFLKEWDSPLDAEMYYRGKKTGAIYNACNFRKSHFAFGYMWKYADGIKKYKFKPVIQYDLNMNYIREWKSATEASNYYGTSKNNITLVCNGCSKSSRGFIWRYKETDVEMIPDKKEKASKRVKIPVIQIDIETNEIIKEWESMKIAADYYNLNSVGISNCCRGKQKTAGGFKWRYKNENI